MKKRMRGVTVKFFDFGIVLVTPRYAKFFEIGQCDDILDYIKPIGIKRYNLTRFKYPSYIEYDREELKNEYKKILALMRETFPDAIENHSTIKFRENAFISNIEKLSTEIKEKIMEIA